jgi:hypothetical protein
MILSRLDKTDPRSITMPIGTELRDYAQIHIPAANLVGGAEALGPGQWLSVTRYTGGTDGTPVAQEKWSVGGRVSAISGNETDKKAVVLAVPTQQAPTLQAALAVTDARLSYMPSDKPISAPTPASSDTPVPTPIFFIAITPESGGVGLEIAADLIASGAALPKEGRLSLIIVPKLLTDGGDQPSSAPPPFNACVTISNFLDENRGVTDETDDAEVVVVELDASRLTEAAAALTHAERVYLVPNNACEAGS